VVLFTREGENPASEISKKGSLFKQRGGGNCALSQRRLKVDRLLREGRISLEKRKKTRPPAGRIELKLRKKEKVLSHRGSVLIDRSRGSLERRGKNQKGTSSHAQGKGRGAGPDFRARKRGGGKEERG